jgi:repressor LexA
MDRLTKKQAETLFLIQRFLREKGYPPTVRELVALTGRKSTSGVQKLLDALEKKGHIKKVPGRSRGIVPREGAQSAWVPVVGGVAAGKPVFSEENIEGYCALDGSVVPEGAFLLRVQGDSMVGDHIQDGDLILVRPQTRAADGSIVVALVDGETTIKRINLRGDGIELAPPHPLIEPLLIRQDIQPRIVGEVVAVLRFLEPAFPFYVIPRGSSNHGEIDWSNSEKITARE